MPLDPQAQVVIDMIQSLGVATLTPGTDPDEIRGLMNAAVLPSPIVLDRLEDTTMPGPGGPLPIRIYRPAGAAPKPIIVYFHGGGWVLGSLDTHDATCRALARDADAVLVSVDYRLAPEHRFPAAVEDADAALAWAAAHADELGGDADRLVVAGDSAGGNLAAVIAQRSRVDGPKVAFQLLIYPVTDHEFTSDSMEDNAEGYFLTRDAMRWFYSHYLNNDAEGDDPRVSPLRADDLGGLPPAFVLTMEYDPLRDQGVAYAHALAAAGTEVTATTYPSLFHGCFGMGEMIDAARAPFDDAVAAIRSAVG